MMRKTIAGIFVMSSLLATTAHAEHKLLITDVLDAKQFEGQATFEYVYEQVSYRGAESGWLKFNTTETRYSLGAGVGHGLEIAASIPYVLSEREQIRPSDPALGTETEKVDGFGDFSLGAKYKFLDEGKGAPVSAVVGLNVKFDTAGGRNNPGSDSTDFTPFIAASRKVSHHVTPYASYRAVIRNHGLADDHILSLGSENEINETVTVDVRFDAIFRTSSDTMASQELYSLELASYLQLAHNFYVIPSVAVMTGSTSHSKEGDVRFGSPFGVATAVSLYYLF